MRSTTFTNYFIRGLFSIGVIALMSGCGQRSVSSIDAKESIIETLNLETRYFCERNLNEWERQWSHQHFVSKMYRGKTEFEEFVGWDPIRNFTANHITDFPEPIPIPNTSPEYKIDLFHDTALVFYSKQGEEGPIREIRFMVKEGEKWKIARMQTIY